MYRYFWRLMLSFLIWAVIAPISQTCAATSNTKTMTLKAKDDTYVTQAAPQKNYGSEKDLQVSYSDEEETAMEETYLFFDLTALPEKATITNATLSLYLKSGTITGARTFELKPVSAPWTQSTLNWSNKPETGDGIETKSLKQDAVGDFVIWGAASTHDTPSDDELTSTIKQWHAAPTSQYGFALLGPEAAPAYSCVFASSESASNVPELKITYTLPGPVISGVTASDLTNTSARITWSTTDQANSYVEYGTSTNLGTTIGTDEYVFSHAVTLQNLQPATTYQYQVQSTDKEGLISTSDILSFVTLAVAATDTSANEPEVTATGEEEIVEEQLDQAAALADKQAEEQARSQALDQNANAYTPSTQEQEAAADATALSLTASDQMSSGTRNSLEKSKDFFLKIAPFVLLTLFLFLVFKNSLSGYMHETIQKHPDSPPVSPPSGPEIRPTAGTTPSYSSEFPKNYKQNSTAAPAYPAPSVTTTNQHIYVQEMPDQTPAPAEKNTPSPGHVVNLSSAMPRPPLVSRLPALKLSQPQAARSNTLDLSIKNKGG